MIHNKGNAALSKPAEPGLDFGEAVRLLKQGHAVTREGWNGKGMFLYHVGADAYPAKTDIAKREFGENALVPYRAYIAMKTAQGDVVPWVASQSDILSNDWQVIEQEGAQQADMEVAALTAGCNGPDAEWQAQNARCEALRMATGLIASGQLPAGDPVELARTFYAFVSGEAAK